LVDTGALPGIMLGFERQDASQIRGIILGCISPNGGLEEGTAYRIIGCGPLLSGNTRTGHGHTGHNSLPHPVIL